MKTSCLALFRLASLATMLALAPGLRAAAPVVLKLGTLVPAGTSYHKNLQAMGEQWQRATDGAVTLRIYPGGTQGGEADMVALMQTGNLTAGLLSVEGLTYIEPAVTALQSMPMSFRTLDEVDYVGEKLRPRLEQRLLEKGYVVLFWTDSGWVRFFSKRPVVHPDDLRPQKVFTWAGDPHEPDLWRAAGFKPVPMETAALPLALKNGGVEAVPMPPFFFVATQLDNDAKHMLELNWAPLVGAAVVRREVWEKIPAETRAKLLAIAVETGRLVKTAGRAEGEAAVVAMQKRGLTVHAVTPEVEAEWRATVEKMNDQIRGKIVPADIYDEVQRLLKEYRAAPPIRINLGTLAPKGNPYDEKLRMMGEQWRTASAGGVVLNVDSSGTQGGEAEMVGLLQAGYLQAGMLSAEGLNHIEPAAAALQFMPMSFRSLDVVDYVGEKLRPMLEQRLLAKGYVVLFWTDTGSVRLFSKKPVLHPDDLRSQKIYTWAGAPHEPDLWRAAGFTPVPMETSAVLPALKNGGIGAVLLPPFFALASQIDTEAKYMLELNWAPLVGAAVVRKEAWEKIPAATRTALLAIAAKTGRAVQVGGRVESDLAVASMKKRGLTVQAVPPEVDAEWRAVVDNMTDQIRGKIVPADIYDEVQRLQKAFRAAAPKQS